MSGGRPPGEGGAGDGGAADVTRLLGEVQRGEHAAVERLFALVYDELRGLAGAQLARERAGHTLQPTALVHEAYVKLLKQESVGFEGRAQFFGVAAQAMRRILVDHARTRKRAKRGGGATPVPLDESLALFEQRGLDLLALDEALGELATRDERKARLVELRFYGGLPLREVAELLGLSQRTAEREWTMARAFLRQRLG